MVLHTVWMYIIVYVIIVRSNFIGESVKGVKILVSKSITDQQMNRR